jgi:hypothetical protein
VPAVCLQGAWVLRYGGMRSGQGTCWSRVYLCLTKVYYVVLGWFSHQRHTGCWGRCSAGLCVCAVACRFATRAAKKRRQEQQQRERLTQQQQQQQTGTSPQGRSPGGAAAAAAAAPGAASVLSSQGCEADLQVCLLELCAHCLIGCKTCAPYSCQQHTAHMSASCVHSGVSVCA